MWQELLLILFLFYYTGGDTLYTPLGFYALEP